MAVGQTQRLTFVLGVAPGYGAEAFGIVPNRDNHNYVAATG